MLRAVENNKVQSGGIGDGSGGKCQHKTSKHNADKTGNINFTRELPKKIYPRVPLVTQWKRT